MIQVGQPDKPALQALGQLETLSPNQGGALLRKST